LPNERPLITSSQQTLGELASSFELYGLCTQCQRMPQLDIAQLIEVFGSQTSVDSIRQRLVCNRCGRRTKNIRVVYRGQAGGAAAFRYLGSDSRPKETPEETREEPQL